MESESNESILECFGKEIENMILTPVGKEEIEIIGKDIWDVDISEDESKKEKIQVNINEIKTLEDMGYTHKMQREEGWPDRQNGVAVEGQKSKRVMLLSKSGLTEIRKTNKNLKHFLVTINMKPEYEFTEAWSIVLNKRRTCIDDLLKKFESIRYIACCVEHHHTVPTGMIGKKREKPEKTKDEKGAEDAENVETGKVVIKDKTQRQREKLQRKAEEKKREEGEELENVKNLPEDALLNAYKSKTLIEFNTRVDTWTLNKVVSRKMTDDDMLVTYYNIIQILSYLNSESKRDEEFKNWITKQRKKLLPYMVDENKKRDWEFNDREKIMISKHEECGKTLVGYPHLHMAIGFEGVKGGDIKKLANEIRKELAYDGEFEDIKVDMATTNEAEENGSCINYVLKNHSNAFVKRTMKRMGDEEEIVQVIINKSNDWEKYYNFFKSYVGKQDKEKIKRVEVTPMDIYLRGEVSEEAPTEKEQIDLMGKNLLPAAIDYVVKFMTWNKYYVNGGFIYKKMKGTRMTYEPEMYRENDEDKPMDVYNLAFKVLSRGIFMVAAKSLAVEVAALAKVNEIELDDKVEYGELKDACTANFPKLLLDDLMFECDDVFLDLATKKMYRKQSLVQCMVGLEVDLIEFLRDSSDWEKTSKWVDFLVSNGEEIYHDEYDMVRVPAAIFTQISPRPCKIPRVIFAGQSGSGKSEAMKPLEQIWPMTKSGSISQVIDVRTVAYALKGKKLVTIHEASKIMNCAQEHLAIFLEVFEGGRVEGRMMREGPSLYVMSTGLICGYNPRQTDTFLDDPAKLERMIILGYLKRIEERVNVANEYGRDKGKIVAYTFKNFLKLIQGKGIDEELDIENLIYDEYTIEDQKESNVYRKKKGLVTIGAIYDDDILEEKRKRQAIELKIEKEDNILIKEMEILRNGAEKHLKEWPIYKEKRLEIEERKEMVNATLKLRLETLKRQKDEYNIMNNKQKENEKNMIERVGAYNRDK